MIYCHAGDEIATNKVHWTYIDTGMFSLKMHLISSPPLSFKASKYRSSRASDAYMRQ